MARAIALCFFLFISFMLANGHLPSGHLIPKKSPPPPSSKPPPLPISNCITPPPPPSNSTTPPPPPSNSTTPPPPPSNSTTPPPPPSNSTTPPPPPPPPSNSTTPPPPPSNSTTPPPPPSNSTTSPPPPSSTTSPPSSTSSTPTPSSSACFPGDALVQMVNGEKKAMRYLEVGDKVGVLSKDEKILYGDIYAFGHKDPNAFNEFLRISLKSRDIFSSHYALELTTLHFVPIMEDVHQGPKYKRAQDIRIGDTMWSMGNSSLEVTDISRVWKQGLYNPLTMDGTIMVNDVLASVHSEWFLDHIFDAFGITSLLPLAYQVILTPLRAIYCILGKHTYVLIYNWVDLMLDVASFGTKYGGTMAIATAVGFVSKIMISNYNKHE